MARFTVFLPVRNGMPYVRECVNGILAQKHPGVEIVILDNMSTDGTAEWVATVEDPRVRLVRSDRSLTMAESWGRTLTMPKGEFMTVIGHDDVFDPDFFDIIDRLIMEHPEASLYTTAFRLIGAGGRVMRRSNVVPVRESAAEYLASRLKWERDVSATGYVFRSADYDRLGGFPPAEGLYFSDDSLWLMLSQQSYKVVYPGVAFSVRLHDGSVSASIPSLWPRIIAGLGIFAAFLERFVENDAASREVLAQHGPGFFHRYHQNAYIYALVEASQKGQRIDPAVRQRIVDSLEKTVPGAGMRIEQSIPVKAVAFLNGTFLRSLVGPLLRARQHLRS